MISSRHTNVKPDLQVPHVYTRNLHRYVMDWNARESMNYALLFLKLFIAMDLLRIKDCLDDTFRG